MSCVCGILRFDGGAVVPSQLDRMLSSMAHRAPDRRSRWADGIVGLGHGLMRVNREDLLERQPLEGREAGTMLVADLRIDNRKELADALAIDAAALDDMPDSALVSAAYREWGEACVDRLLGDFAFALWDQRAGKLVLARDHMGQRCLYFHKGAGFFAFATELRGLLTLPDIPRRLSETFIACWLVAREQWPVGLTHVENVLALGGGRVMTVHRDGRTTERVYWQPGPGQAHEGGDEAHFVAAYRSVLEEAVGCRIRRLLRPAALGLSGGFDSGAIAGLAGPIVRGRGRKLVAVSAVGPADAPASRDPRLWVALCGRFMPHLDIHYVEAGAAGILDGIEGTFLSADGPASPAHHVDRALLAAASRAGARLYLDGMGGDYTVNHRGQAALAYFLKTGRLARFLRELRADKAMTGRPMHRALVSDVLARLAPRPWLRALRPLRPAWSEERLPTMIATRFRARIEAEGSGILSGEIDLLAHRSDMRAECLDLCRAVPTYPPRQQAIMAAMQGMDYSQPFHDPRVVELGLAIPESLYVKNGRNRYLACRALHDVLPPEFQHRDRGQTSGAPGLEERLLAEKAGFLGEIDRLAARDGGDGPIDYERARAATADLGSSRTVRPMRALNAVLLGRFAEWFQRDNS